MAANWFKTGQTGRVHSVDVDKQAQVNREKSQLGAWRFKLKSNESAKIVILDEGEAPSFFFSEHSMYNITHRSEYETCIKDSDDGPCPLDDFNNASYALALTVIDTRSYTSKDGKVFARQKRVLVAKGRARERWLKRAETRGFNLRGAVFEVSRGSATTESNVGEDIVDTGRTLTEAQLQQLCPEGMDFAKWSKPLGNEGYAKFFAPKTASQLREIVGAKPPVGSSEDIGGEESEGPADIASTGLDDLI